MRVLALLLVLLGSAVEAQVCGDLDGNGHVTVTDGVLALRLAAGLPIDGPCAVLGEPTATPQATPQATTTPAPTPITDPLVDMLGTWQFTTANVDFQPMRQDRLTTVTDDNGTLTVRGVDQDGDEVRVIKANAGTGATQDMVLEHTYCRTQFFAHTLGTDSVHGMTFFGYPEGSGCVYIQTRDMEGVRIAP